jgi:AraC-like DNA-binding protein/quercetin dioxygenase-like cupin family protein
MLTGSQRGAGEGGSLADYHASRVPGLQCSTLVHDGPPQARVEDRFVLFTLTAGSARTWCRGKPHALTPGDVLLLEPGDVHRDIEKTPYTAVTAMFHSDLVSRWADPAFGGRLGASVARCPTLSAATLALVEAVRAGQERALQERLLQSVFRCWAPFWARTAPLLEPPLVARARKLFQESSGTLLSLDELGRRLRCAPSYVCRVFSGYTGVGPHAYQLQLRLLDAANLIEDGRTVAAAAALTGFRDESHLRRHFRRRFALTPGRYQKELAPRKRRALDLRASESRVSRVGAFHT